MSDPDSDPRPDSDPESGDPTAALRDLWRAYAAGLDALGGVAPAGTATRFRETVLTPAGSPDPSGVVAAAVAWPEFAPDRLSLTTHPDPAELAGLRDRLAALSREFDELPSAKSRWLGGAAHPTIPVTPELRELIGAGRRAFDRLSKPLPPGLADQLADLRRIAGEVDALFAAAPASWPPAAPWRVRALAEHATVAFAGPLAELTDRMSAALTGPPSDPESVAAEVADRLLTLVDPDPDRAAWLDRAFALVRGWGGGVGVRFLPASWSFADPPELAELQEAGVEIGYVFRDNEPKGTAVRVKAIGLAQGDAVVRPGMVSVSAGPVPAGLPELEDAVAELTGPTADIVRTRLKGWRTASVDGTFETAAVDLFVTYWDDLIGPLRDDNGDRVIAVGERLADVLSQELGLSVYSPTQFHDQPEGWVQIAAGRVNSGRIRQLFRPGLVDAAGRLRSPARVEVE